MQYAEDDLGRTESVLFRNRLIGKLKAQREKKMEQISTMTMTAMAIPMTA